MVLLDNDHLGSHIKSVHKMKEKAYKEQYILSNKVPALAKQNCKDNELRTNVARKDLLKKFGSKNILPGNVLSKGRVLNKVEKKVGSKKNVPRNQREKSKGKVKENVEV